MWTAPREQGVGLVVNPGCTVASSRTAVELARRFPHVYAAVGIHPENCGDFRPEDLDAIRALAREDKVVAIGEIGLDYYWPENPPRPLQGSLSRSITRRSDQNRKIKYCFLFCDFASACQKSPFGLF